MLTVEEIRSSIQTEMDSFEEYFLNAMKSDVDLLNKVTHFMVKKKGKQIRPMFVFLVAKMLGKVEKSTYDAATLVELLHTATIVHDDVVDDAHERRGYFSVNALWKNKIAVLVGDYMLSKILLISIENKDVDMLNVISKVVKEMSEGELLQIEKARLLNITEEVYFDIIRKKTASLISACCETAALSVNREDFREKMRRFGEYIGMAFQIKDDIFDYGLGDHIGKPTGNDIREQKLTLPLIYTLNVLEADKKRKMVNILKNHYTNSKKIQEIVKLVIESGGIRYAEEEMRKFVSKALFEIEDIPESREKEILISLVHYTIERIK